MATYGWAGKILRIDLSTGDITTESSEKYQKYIGGMGMGYRIIYEDVPLNTDPYDEAAEIVAAVGPLTGSSVPCSGRMNFSFLSPFSKGKSIIDAHMGGHFSTRLKHAGYDALVVRGKASSPVYIRINDDDVAIEDASHIWGKGTFDTNKILTEDLGREYQTASIGPAGENLVNMSTINTSVGNSGGGGIGAVMGSKNLKAFAIRGTGSVKLADPEKVLELNEYMLTQLIGGNNNHNVPAVPQSWAEYSSPSGNNRWAGAPGRAWQKSDGGPIDQGEQPHYDMNKIAYRCNKGVFDFGEVSLNYTVKVGGCSSCPIRCYTQYDMDPLADYDLPTQVSNTCIPIIMAQTYYPSGVKDFKYKGDGRMVLNGANSRAADDMGVWCNYANLYRDFRWLITSGKMEEVASQEEIDSMPWEWEKTGDPRWIAEIYRRIAYKEGELFTGLGLGTYEMVNRWNLGKEFYDRVDSLNQNITYNGYPKHHANEDTGQIGLLFNLVYNRDCMIHHAVNVTGSGCPYDVSKATMEGFFGEGCWDKPKAFTPMNRNKAKVAKWGFNGKNFHDSATLCNWMWPMTQSPSKERNYVGDLELDAKFMTAVTGINYTQDDVNHDSERISQLLRGMTAISFYENLGETNLRTSHDAIPDWVFDMEPDFEPFEEGTIKMDREDMELAVDMFYEELGWDKETGIPTRATLEKFDLGDLADDLDSRGLLPS